MTACRTAILAAALAACAPSGAHAGVIDIVSSPPDPFALGAQGNETVEHFGAQAFSDDARYVVVDTLADNLVPGDDNHDYDVYLKDRTSGAMTLASHRPDGRPGSSQSYDSAISGNGRYVAFWSEAGDLVAGDTNGEPDVFLFDRTTGVVERVSVGPAGAQGDGMSDAPSVSRDGRYVLFLSSATNLVAGDTNGVDDAFVRDRQLGLTLRVSVGVDGVQGDNDVVAARFDATGRFVCFVGTATNLVPGDTNARNDVFVRDVAQGTTTLISRTPGGAPGNGSAQDCAVAPDSGAVVFDSAASDLVAGDSNASSDIFVYEPAGGITRIEAGEPGVNGGREPDISADARFVVFTSAAPFLPGPDRPAQTQAYLHDRSLGTTLRLSLTPGGAAPANPSFTARIAPNGTAVLYNALSDDQVAGDSNHFRDGVIYDVATGTRQRAGVPAQALPSGAGGQQASVSADGRYTAFVSAAVALAPGIANGVSQVYLHDAETGTVTLVTRNASGTAAAAGFEPQLSADGRWLAFVSAAPDLVAGMDSYNASDVFLHDRMVGTTVRVTNDAMGEGANRHCDRLAMSADGNRLAFVTSASNLLPSEPTVQTRLLVYDRTAGTLVRADVGAAGQLPNASVTERASLSADGRYVAFADHANSFIPVDPNPYIDVFRKDLTTGDLLLVSRRTDGGAANEKSHHAAISGDGRYVAYRSIATNLVDGDDNGTGDIFRTDIATGTTIRITSGLRGPSTAQQQNPVLSHDGHVVAFESDAALVPGDANGRLDVHLYETRFGLLRRASIGPTGAEYDSTSHRIDVSLDGQWLVFDMTPSRVAIAGRYNAPQGPDILKARNPLAEFIFLDGYE